MIRITYDPSVDGLYIRFTEEPAECQVIRPIDQVSINIGPQEQVVGLEVLDATETLAGLAERNVHLENLVAAS